MYWLKWNFQQNLVCLRLWSYIHLLIKIRIQMVCRKGCWTASAAFLSGYDPGVSVRPTVSWFKAAFIPTWDYGISDLQWSSIDILLCNCNFSCTQWHLRHQRYASGIYSSYTVLETRSRSIRLYIREFSPRVPRDVRVWDSSCSNLLLGCTRWTGVSMRAYSLVFSRWDWAWWKYRPLGGRTRIW